LAQAQLTLAYKRAWWSCCTQHFICFSIAAMASRTIAMFLFAALVPAAKASPRALRGSAENATLPEAPSPLAEALLRASRGDVVAADVAALGSFCVGRHAGSYCLGTTKVDCCLGLFGLGICGTFLGFTGCPLGIPVTVPLVPIIIPPMLPLPLPVPVIWPGWPFLPLLASAATNGTNATQNASAPAQSNSSSAALALLAERATFRQTIENETLIEAAKGHSQSPGKNSSDVAMIDSVFFGSFCTAKPQGWYCLGTTRVDCCVSAWGMAACGTSLSFYGCPLGLPVPVALPPIPVVPIHPVIPGLPPLLAASAEKVASAAPTKNSTESVVSEEAMATLIERATFRGSVEAAEDEVRAETTFLFNSFCKGKQQGWYCWGTSRVDCCSTVLGVTSCGSFLGYRGCPLGLPVVVPLPPIPIVPIIPIFPPFVPLPLPFPIIVGPLAVPEAANGTNAMEEAKNMVYP